MSTIKMDSCPYCKTIHECQRCGKFLHICLHCGGMTHTCGLCGKTFATLMLLKQHKKLKHPPATFSYSTSLGEVRFGPGTKSIIYNNYEKITK
jgi:hypothetical protein